MERNTSPEREEEMVSEEEEDTMQAVGNRQRYSEDRSEEIEADSNYDGSSRGSKSRKSSKRRKKEDNSMDDEESEEWDEDDDDEGQIDESVKLLEFKKARKKAEEDALALRNRIMLLEQENVKMMKKIKGTKKKAIEIMRIKNRKKEKEDEKRRLQKEKNEIKKMKKQRIQKIKREKEKLKQSQGNINSNSMLLAQNTKNMLKTLRENYRKKKKRNLSKQEKMLKQ